MAVSDKLAYATKIINSKEWNAYLRPEYKTNLDSPENQRKFSRLRNSILELRNMEAYSNFNSVDEIVDAIFGNKGIQLQFSIIGSMVSTNTVGDLLDFQTTMSGDFISALNLQNAVLYDLSIEITNTSKIANILAVGKEYWATLGPWALAFIRTTPYAGLRSINGNFIDDNSAGGFRATSADYINDRERLEFADLTELYMNGLLVDADTAAGVAGEIKTGTLKLRGKYSAGHKPITV